MRILMRSRSRRKRILMRSGIGSRRRILTRSGSRRRNAEYLCYEGGMDIIAHPSPTDMNLKIEVDDEDDEMDDQEMFDADVGEDLLLLSLEAKPSCKTAQLWWRSMSSWLSLSRMLHAPTSTWLAILSVSHPLLASDEDPTCGCPSLYENIYVI